MRISLRLALIGLIAAGATAADGPSDLVITSDITLDPAAQYRSITIKKSGVTIDGRGAWLIGPGGKSPKEFKGIAIVAIDVSNVTLKNINAKGWETGLHVRNGREWTIENCNFSDNFHDPDFGWGENGRRGGMVLEYVRDSHIVKNKANRVWDACVLVDCTQDHIEGNDFSHTSNTCLKLWNSRRNTTKNNVLSYGIRISPGEVHARDSTCVLIESGSNDNLFMNNDCTHGGDGIFVRVLNNWCSTDNHFEGNDCSYANNNGVECWAPLNTFEKNKANHCSYGFWLGGSDKTRLIENEASFNGLTDGHHNSPHLPDKGHAGIVFMFGPSSHTLARGNVCEGNNGAGIALVGDLGSKGQKWKAYHWVIEQNKLTKNRWGLYAKHADWITVAGNEYRANDKNVLLDGDVTRFTESTEKIPATAKTPFALLMGPAIVPVGEARTWTDSPKNATAIREQRYTWDVGDGRLREGLKLDHTFARAGFHRIGLNVTNGTLTEPHWRDVYVVNPVAEIGTEGGADNWMIEDFEQRTRIGKQVSRVRIEDDRNSRLLGNVSLSVVIEPYSGERAMLTYPKLCDAKWSLTGKTKLCFWFKSINADVHGWQGGPFIVLHGDGDERCYIEPKAKLDPLAKPDLNEARDGWRLFEIPLAETAEWKVDGKVPTTARAISLGVDSWGTPTLRLWIDGLAFE